MNQRTNRSARGMSLIEGMISMAVLLIGILGALQGTLFASNQNTAASRLARATSMAAQIRLGLESQGRARLLSSTPTNGPLTSANCVAVGSAGATLQGLTDGLYNTTVANACIVDIDKFDGGAAGGGSGGGAAAADKVVTNYNFAQDWTGATGIFRRVVVYLPGIGGAADTLSVIVSITDGTRRVYVKQAMGLYNSAPSPGNGTLVDL